MQTTTLSILVSAGLIAYAAPAVTLSSAPTFTPSTNAVLAGMLSLATDVPSRVSVSVSDGKSTWVRNFHNCCTNHAEVLAGFKPGRTNQILVTVYDQAQTAQTAAQPLIFVTPQLPADFPHSTVLQSQPTKMEPGYTLFLVQNRTAKTGYITILDNLGEVVWYCQAPSLGDFDVRQMANGDLFLEEQKPANRFTEINLLGQTVQTWSPPAAYPINDHEGVLTEHGTILYISDVSEVVSNFPSGPTNSAPLVTATVDDNPVVEISVTNGVLLNAWAPIDQLDPTRVTYLTYQFPTAFGIDNEHANAALEDTTDNSLIVSVRDQNTVYKFLRSTGQVKWILAPHANWAPKFQPYLLSPVGTPFSWCYGQHAPELTPRHTLILYDDGNARAEPFAAPVPDQNNYSRAVEYSINETNMQISQVWDSSQASGDRLFTPALGDADVLPITGNVLVTYGLVTYVNGAHPSSYAINASMARIIEMTHDAVPSAVFDISFFDPTNTQPNYAGYLCYRSDRIADLYAHPPMPVQDLTVATSSGGPLLQFSADPTRTYTVQSSTDLLQWQNLGTPSAGTLPDTFVFQDATANSLAAARFYRVVAH